MLIELQTLPEDRIEAAHRARIADLGAWLGTYRRLASSRNEAPDAAALGVAMTRAGIPASEQEIGRFESGHAVVSAAWLEAYCAAAGISCAIGLDVLDSQRMPGARNMDELRLAADAVPAGSHPRPDLVELGMRGPEFGVLVTISLVLPALTPVIEPCPGAPDARTFREWSRDPALRALGSYGWRDDPDGGHTIFLDAGQDASLLPSSLAGTPLRLVRAAAPAYRTMRLSPWVELTTSMGQADPAGALVDPASAGPEIGR